MERWCEDWILRVLFLMVLVFSSFVYADEQSEYLGSSYTLDLAFEPSCLQFVGATDIVNEHIGALAKLGFCDMYTNGSQDYLRQSYTLGGGISYYQNSIYRDGFFGALTLNFEKAWVDNILSDSSGESISLVGGAGLGYQFHFKRGYKISLVVYYMMLKNINYDDNADTGINEALLEGDNVFHPTLLIGWRF